MYFHPADESLTDELAEEIRLELERGPEDETRATAAVRPVDEGRLELVLSDEDGEEPDVVVALTRDEARALAATLVALAREEPRSA